MNSKELDDLKNQFIYQPIKPSRKTANYFDPTVAPALTGPSYCLISNKKKDRARDEFMNSIDPLLLD